jgi:hypothetical protein
MQFVLEMIFGALGALIKWSLGRPLSDTFQSEINLGCMVLFVFFAIIALGIFVFANLPLGGSINL